MLYFENNLFNEGVPTVPNFKDSLNIGIKIGTNYANSESSKYFDKQDITIAEEILEPRQLQDLKNIMDEINKGMGLYFKKLDSQ